MSTHRLTTNPLATYSQIRETMQACAARDADARAHPRPADEWERSAASGAPATARPGETGDGAERGVRGGDV